MVGSLQVLTNQHGRANGGMYDGTAVIQVKWFRFDRMPRIPP
jgi:hypothetical protein